MERDTRVGLFELAYRSYNPDCWIQYDYSKPNSEDAVTGYLYNDEVIPYIKAGQWNHFAVSFNKRALKIYINDNRIVNLPNVQAPERFKFWSNGDYKYVGFTNVLLCAGAKELYERETTNLSEAAKAVEQAIAQTGKFVTNNILFDTGKATIKPESEPEIDKVAEYMKANPTARFEVQGHTDSQGSDKVNDPLSQERAEAVVKALEAKGVDPFNLRAVGKGSHEPVADNSTDAGRAQNRRVEFIKK
ncbi:MAG: OmpA family protein [Bacteroidales bacterium]|nr:OmpA family protein [Bacteroidales bacterium]